MREPSSVCPADVNLVAIIASAQLTFNLFSHFQGLVKLSQWSQLENDATQQRGSGEFIWEGSRQL